MKNILFKLLIIINNISIRIRDYCFIGYFVQHTFSCSLLIEAAAATCLVGNSCLFQLFPSLSLLSPLPLFFLTSLLHIFQYSSSPFLLILALPYLFSHFAIKSLKNCSQLCIRNEQYVFLVYYNQYFLLVALHSLLVTSPQIELHQNDDMVQNRRKVAQTGGFVQHHAAVDTIAEPIVAKAIRKQL